MPASTRRLAAVAGLIAIATVVLPEASTLPDSVLQHAIEERMAEEVLGYYMTSRTYRLRDPARLHIVAVGDATKIKDALATKGELLMFDTDGKPIASAPTTASR